MYIKVIVTVWLAFLLNYTNQLQLDHYCRYVITNLPCNTKCQMIKSCCKKVEYTTIVNLERIWILDLMNQIREELASGTHPLGYPPAGNINVLSYDKECEFMAKCYSTMCTSDKNVVLLSIDGTVLGVLRTAKAISSTKVDQMEHLNINQTILAWYLGVFDAPKFNKWHYNKYLQVLNRKREENVFEAYMQMIWADTKYVGCWRSVHKANEKTILSFTCVFKPTGILNNRVAYLTGKPASLCKTKASEPSYPSLCGKIRPWSEDNYEPPPIVSTSFSKPSSIEVICLEIIIVFIITGFGLPFPY